MRVVQSQHHSSKDGSAQDAPSARLASPFWATLSSILLHGLVVIAALIAFRYGWMFTQRENAINTQDIHTSEVEHDVWHEDNQDRGLSAIDTPAEQIMNYLMRTASLHRHMTAQERTDAIEERLQRLEMISDDRLQMITDRIVSSIGVRDGLRDHPIQASPDRVHYRLTKDGQFLTFQMQQALDEDDGQSATMLDRLNMDPMIFDTNSALQVDIRVEPVDSGQPVYVFVMVDRYGTQMEIERPHDQMSPGDFARLQMYELARRSPKLQSLLYTSTVAAMELENRRSEAERQYERAEPVR